jgi:uncharacterized protein
VSRQAYIAARAPRSGQVKTRLAAALGDAAALDLYRAFLSDLADEFTGIGWFVTPADAWRDIAPIVARRAQPPTCILDQGPGDWTARQRFLFETAAERGEERTVLIGSDSPHLRSSIVEEAFGALDDHDVVFGPTPDGGYYLIGMRGWHDVLAGVPMSTESVFAQIQTQARTMGVSMAVLGAAFDVDEADDLTRLRAAVAASDGLPATRGALARLDARVAA